MKKDNSKEYDGRCDMFYAWPTKFYFCEKLEQTWAWRLKGETNPNYDIIRVIRRVNLLWAIILYFIIFVKQIWIITVEIYYNSLAQCIKKYEN